MACVDIAVRYVQVPHFIGSQGVVPTKFVLDQGSEQIPPSGQAFEFMRPTLAKF
jgi:hypothetical protein